jgi:exopolyphosphatase/pppGpp-phosphohydrolase
MRDASNGALFAERLERELGIGTKSSAGEAEARYGFDGRCGGLGGFGRGVLFDVGGAAWN